MPSFQMPHPPATPCCEYYGPEKDEGCHCCVTERALRAWAAKKVDEPMTSEQRSWCLGHIGAVEGYKVEDYEKAEDARLAKTVMEAWLDYCRDRDLL